ncbi:hypothetical protein [Actinomadura sp. DC4]|uniref:hypothetical protein n=1 Tax=Actinomadura sp. DC4 TaxID=3055069 RepID=UPI0025B19D7D|nr:hypothetical protein [Actinomadura sp. DC4]MDN3356076.1 hypothetical protein [Actinomadura sp. DC4]
MKDLFNNVKCVPTITNAARTTTATGTGVDRAGYMSAMVVVHTGTMTDGTHTLTIEESDDNSTWGTVAAGNLQGTPPALGSSDDDKIVEIGYLGGKRYIRAKSTVSGSPSTGGVYDALVLLGDPRTAPVVRP